MWCAKSQLKSAVRAPPMWRKPVGDGAKRTRTAELIFQNLNQAVTKSKMRPGFQARKSRRRGSRRQLREEQFQFLSSTSVSRALWIAKGQCRGRIMLHRLHSRKI